MKDQLHFTTADHHAPSGSYWTSASRSGWTKVCHEHFLTRIRHSKFHHAKGTMTSGPKETPPWDVKRKAAAADAVKHITGVRLLGDEA
jgi:hypothetical protein